MKELAPAVNNMERLAEEFTDDPETTLPAASPLESAKSYREKKAKPLFSRIVKVLRSVYRCYVELKGKYENLLQSYNRECYKTSQMGERMDKEKEQEKIKKCIGENFKTNTGKRIAYNRFILD